MRKVRVCWFVFLLIAFSVVTQTDAQHTLDTISTDNLAHLQEIAYWTSEQDRFSAATFSPEGQTLALTLNDGQVQLLDSITLLPYQTLEGADIVAARLQYSADGDYVLLYDYDGKHILWDVNSGERLVYQPEALGRNFEITADLTTYLFVSNDLQTIRVHDLHTSEERFQISIEEYSSPNPTFSPDGMLLLTRGERASVLLWDVNSGTVLHQIEPEWEFVHRGLGDLQGMGFTPSGDVWVSWTRMVGEEYRSESTIQFWNVDGQQFTSVFEGEHWYQRMVFEPTGRYAAVIGEAVVGGTIPILDSQFWLWDIQSGQQIGLRQGSTGGVSLAFHPSGDFYAYTGGTMGSVHLQEVGVDTSIVRLEVSGSGYPEFAATGDLLLYSGFFEIRLWGIPAT